MWHDTTVVHEVHHAVRHEEVHVVRHVEVYAVVLPPESPKGLPLVAEKLKQFVVCQELETHARMHLACMQRALSDEQQRDGYYQQCHHLMQQAVVYDEQSLLQ